MLARASLWFYGRIHHDMRLPGAGWLLRRMARVFRTLQNCPLAIPGAGTARLDLRDDAAYSLLNYSLGERDNHEALLELMIRVLPPGGSLWDVGANVGQVSAWLSRRLTPPSTIHAFEPVPGPRMTLETLFDGHPVVRVHPVGLGARDEVLTIQSCPTSSALNSLRGPLPGAMPVEIRVRRGDLLRAELNLPAPQVIKVDVEGFEPEVLAGLTETITRGRPVIFLEHILLNDEQVRGLIPPGYQMLFQLEDGQLTADFSRRMEGHNAVLFPLGHRAFTAEP